MTTLTLIGREREERERERERKRKRERKRERGDAEGGRKRAEMGKNIKSDGRMDRYLVRGGRWG